MFDVSVALTRATPDGHIVVRVVANVEPHNERRVVRRVVRQRALRGAAHRLAPAPAFPRGAQGKAPAPPADECETLRVPRVRLQPTPMRGVVVRVFRSRAHPRDVARARQRRGKRKAVVAVAVARRFVIRLRRRLLARVSRVCTSALPVPTRSRTSTGTGAKRPSASFRAAREGWRRRAAPPPPLPPRSRRRRGVWRASRSDAWRAGSAGCGWWPCGASAAGDSPRRGTRRRARGALPATRRAAFGFLVSGVLLTSPASAAGRTDRTRVSSSRERVRRRGQKAFAVRVRVRDARNRARARASGRSLRVSPRGYARRHRVRSRFGWVRLLILIGSARDFRRGGGGGGFGHSGESRVWPGAHLGRARGSEVHRAHVARSGNRGVVHPTRAGRLASKRA